MATRADPAVTQWMGITRDETYVSPGSLYAQNTRMWTTGELQRRSGLIQSSQTSGQSMSFLLHPVAGRLVIFYTAAGTVIANAV